jgi:hypothetical protein
MKSYHAVIAMSDAQFPPECQFSPFKQTAKTEKDLFRSFILNCVCIYAKARSSDEKFESELKRLWEPIKKAIEFTPQ